MKKVAVLGGTRYVGRRVVEGLLESGVEVTLVTRGLTPDRFGDRVRRRTADVGSADQLAEALTRDDDDLFDVVLHQVAYHPPHARALLAATQGRARRLVLASTIEVYNPQSLRSAPGAVAGATSSPHTEESLDLVGYPIVDDAPWDDPAYLEEHYGEGKRQAEAIVLEAPIPAATVRLAHVLGSDDPTGRLRMLADHVRSRTPIAVDHRPGATSFVHADQAASTLVQLMRDAVTGPVNLAAPDPMNTTQLVAALGTAAGIEPVLVTRPVPAHAEHAASPFTYPSDFAIDTGRLRSLVGDLDPVTAWLPYTLASFID
jgi:nucleoside-diphosphate-sugar epimerase